MHLTERSIIMMISGNKYRIKSGRRFTLSVAILIILTVTTSYSLLGFSDASSMTEPTYLTIEVQYGDTLWNIARTYMTDYRDVRKAVHQLCLLNGITACDLQAGQTLLIPAE